MRRCLIGDIMAAASVIGAADAQFMQQKALRLLAEADAAHRYYKRFARPHPTWGNGSLMARAMAEPLALPANFSCPTYLHAFTTLSAALTRFRLFARHNACEHGPVTARLAVLFCDQPGG